MGELMDELSSDKAMQDFLRRMLQTPVRAMLEHLVPTPEQLSVRDYDAETERLRTQMKSEAVT